MTHQPYSRLPALLRTAAVTFGAIGGTVGTILGGLRLLGIGWFSGAPSWWGYLVILGVPAGIASLVTVSARADALLSAIWMYFAGTCLSISLINPPYLHTPWANAVGMFGFTGFLVLLSAVLFHLEYLSSARLRSSLTTPENSAASSSPK